jgi:hypothetical protein
MQRGHARRVLDESDHRKLRPLGGLHLQPRLVAVRAVRGVGLLRNDALFNFLAASNTSFPGATMCSPNRMGCEFGLVEEAFQDVLAFDLSRTPQIEAFENSRSKA